jgi:hypothetical protein
MRMRYGRCMRNKVRGKVRERVQDEEWEGEMLEDKVYCPLVSVKAFLSSRRTVMPLG